ncbi:MAG: hypothetical protein KJ061_13155 [Vicinamibacteraceae bacterium]|nr:hypothetical protein [Vicinamibacteraceae bacterium]
MSLLVPFSAAMATAVLATLLVRRVAPLVGAVARPVADRWHRTEIPLLGGLALGLGVLAGALAGGLTDIESWLLLGGAFTLLLVGLVDDLRALRPQSKLLAQLLVASALAAMGLQLRLTGYPTLDVLVTILWTVGIVNAVNLLDNMDGLAAGIAAIAVGFRLWFFLEDGDLQGAMLAASVLGATLAFLVFNTNPASIFMGDAGSLLLGTLVAGMSLTGDWAYSRGVVSVLLLPVLLLLVPIFDTTFVTAARLLAGRPVSQGGRDHTSHRLVALGLTERQAVVVLYVVALLSGSIARFSYGHGLSYSAVFVALLVLGLALLGVYLGRLRIYPDASTAPEVIPPRLVRLVSNFSYTRQVATVGIDFVLVVVAYYGAYMLRFEGRLMEQQPVFIASLPLVIGGTLSAMWGMRIYQGVWRYTSVRDLIRLGQAVSLGVVVSVLALLLVYRFVGYSRAVFVIYWLLLLVLVGGSRLSFRALGELLPRRPLATAHDVVIYGAGDGGVMVLRELRNNPALGMVAVAFLDDDRGKHRTTINGVPVVGGCEKLESLLLTHRVGEVVVSSPKIDEARLLALDRLCETYGVPVRRATLTFV